MQSALDFRRSERAFQAMVAKLCHATDGGSPSRERMDGNLSFDY